ncbi:MAG: c-type cytochrome biogenesis protein CcsB [Desulfuromonadales bacterium C00003094]|jgi:cytochrome c-type biogenesis protein CcsB|nr:MAG: c-type cytochrome biogenesis protein CcsB [Desulfuromonadales bacterium C00003094]
MSNLLFKITLLCYLVASSGYLVHIASGRGTAEKIGRWLLRGGFVLHCLTLGWRFFEAGYTPVTNLHESLSFFAWCITGIFLLFDLRYGLAVLGAFLSPLALLLMLIGNAVPRHLAQPSPMLDSWWFPIHVSLAFLGNAVFAVAFIAGLMYLLQERMLKSKRLSALFFRLPSLDTLDTLNYRCLTWGFPLMTMGIISGAAWAHSTWGSYWRWDPKETWALISWFVYAALLHGRLAIGWRGRRAALLAIIGFLCLLFTFLGVNLLLSGLHSFEALSGR